VHPRRVLWRSAERTKDENAAVDREVGQRREPRLAGLGAGRRQQHDVGALKGAAHFSTVGPELLDNIVVARFQGVGVVLKLVCIDLGHGPVSLRTGGLYSDYTR
jgi:hypothetical protein